MGTYSRMVEIMSSINRWAVGLAVSLAMGGYAEVQDLVPVPRPTNLQFDMRQREVLR